MPATTMEDLRAVRSSVLAALQAAGLPMDSNDGRGVDVELSWDDDASLRFVYITWRVHPHVRESMGAALLAGTVDSPELRFNFSVGSAMADAMITILETCGFAVERGDDDSPNALIVREPPNGTPFSGLVASEE